MAELVFGLATSHSPMLTLESKRWSERAADDQKGKSLNLSDGRYVSHEELAKENGAPYGEIATEENFLKFGAAAQRALDRISDGLEKAAPEVVIIVGDDRAELFTLSNMPSISIFYGDEILTRERHITEQTPVPPPRATRWTPSIHSRAFDVCAGNGTRLDRGRRGHRRRREGRRSLQGRLWARLRVYHRTAVQGQADSGSSYSAKHLLCA